MSRTFTSFTPAPGPGTIDRTLNAKRDPAPPLLRLSNPSGGRYMWINKGKPGSLQTAAEMARLVREDTIKDEGLQRFAAQLLINRGVDSHAGKRTIAGVLCEYVQTIPYVYDPIGSFDSVSSARHTIAKGFGDCDDLAVLLATLLALVGLEPRFVLARYKQGSKGYDHVYVDAVFGDLSDPRNRMALDPCSRNHGPGWESSRFYERLMYPIFAFPVASVSGLGFPAALATQGAAIGLNFIPIVGPVLSSLVGPVSGLFNRQQQRSEEAARDQFKDEVYAGMERIKQAVNSCQVTPAQGVTAAKQLVTEYYRACDSFTKKSVAASCRNFQTPAGGFDSRTADIQQAGGNCAGALSDQRSGRPLSDSRGSSLLPIDSGSGASSANTITASLGGSVGGFPILLLLAGGAALFFMMRK